MSRPKRFNERDSADSLRDMSHVLGGWFPSLTFASRVKRYFPAVFLILLVVIPMRAYGRLRTLGRIEKVGLFSEKSLDLGVILEGCEWDAVSSSDGGRTWRLRERVQLPETLADLPAQGEIRYQLIDNRLILRSDDSGSTWTDVSPWQFLRLAVQNDVKAEKGRFLDKYGHWLPQSQAWPFAFAGAVAVLLAIGGWYARKLRGRWMAPVVLSFTSYCLFGLGLYLVHGLFIRWLCSDQWTSRLGHWDNGVSFPNWPMGVLLHLIGSGWFAPVTAAVLFPATPLWGYIISGQPSTRLRKRLALASGIPLACLLMLLVTSWIEGIGRGWDYGVEATANGQQDGPANGRQPIRSETNSPSSAAGARR